MLEFVIFAICAILLLVYYKLWTATKYWKRKGVPYEQPWILIGNMAKVIFEKQIMGELIRNFYNKSKSERYYGMYYFTQPCLILRDLDLIKQVTIRDFSTFHKHGDTVCQSTDAIISQLLFFITDEEKWRNVRSAVSPAFTSSKIRTMFGLINNCAIHLTTFLEEKDMASVETKSLFSRYTIDIIGNCCVGFPCNSFQDPCNKLFSFSHNALQSLNSIKLVIHNMSPVLAKVLNLRLLDKISADYWNSFILKIIKFRAKEVYRNDMMQVLLKFKNRQYSIEQKAGNNSNHWSRLESEKAQYRITDHDIICQTLMILFAGYDTSASTLTFAAYELAINWKVQDILQQEIDAVLDKCGDDSLRYDEIMQMQYLDAVVSETLRKWPAVPHLDRRSNKEFVIEPKTPNEKPLILESGLNVWIPIMAVHRDPEYYPDPDSFNPDRFLVANRSSIVPFTYFPFGLGPRSCLGSRLAIIQVKVLLFHILAKFNIVPVEDTPIPMVTTGVLAMEPKRKCWLGFKPRKKEEYKAK